MARRCRDYKLAELHELAKQRKLRGRSKLRNKAALCAALSIPDDGPLGRPPPPQPLPASRTRRGKPGVGVEIRGRALAARIRGDYALVRQISEGTYGAVWYAERVGTGERVAIKEMALQRDGVPQLREIDIPARLTHPNINRHLAFFFDRVASEKFVSPDEPAGESVFLVMQLADGTLERYVERGSPALETRVRLMYELASAVAFLHRHGVYHCDVKPANVLMFDGELRLADLGLAQYETVPIEVCQTLTYAAPEAIVALHDYVAKDVRRKLEDRFGRQPVMRRAIDLWALGCCFVFILAGARPFPYASDSGLADELIAYADDPDEYLALRGVTDPGWRSVVRSMLEPDVGARIKSVEDVLAHPEFVARGYARPVPGRLERIVRPEVPPGDPRVPRLVGFVERMAVETGARAETAFLAVDLLYRLAPRFAATGDPGSDDRLDGTCFLIAHKLTEADPWPYGVPDGAILDTERRAISELHGCLYPPNLFTYAFSLASLRAALPVLDNAVAYPGVRPRALMAAMEAREKPAERENRRTKDVRFAMLTAGP